MTWVRNPGKDFCCADAYCSCWWDSELLATRNSGDSEDNVKQLLIEAMWLYQLKQNPDLDKSRIEDNNIITQDDSDINEASNSVDKDSSSKESVHFSRENMMQLHHVTGHGKVI